MSWFGSEWSKDIADLDDMRKRAGGGVITILWCALVVGIIWGKWDLPSGTVYFLVSTASALFLLVILAIFLFMPRIFTNALLYVGSFWLPYRKKIDSLEGEPQSEVVSGELERSATLTRDESKQPPASHGRISHQHAQLGSLLLSWIRSNDGDVSDLRYHCGECETHPEVSVRLIPPERGIRVATGSQSYPVGPICPKCRKLLGQWRSKTAFDVQVREVLDASR